MALFYRVVKVIIYLVDRAIPSSEQWGLEDIIIIIINIVTIIIIIIITIKILSILFIGSHVFILDFLDIFVCFILLKCTKNNRFPLERFSNDCRKTKTKAITPTNHNRGRQCDEPIIVLSNYLINPRNVGKITHTWCDWFLFWFSLVEKLARIF